MALGLPFAIPFPKGVPVPALDSPCDLNPYALYLCEKSIEGPPIIEPNAIEGDASMYADFDNSDYTSITGTITAFCSYYNDGTGWVEDYELTSEIDNVNKRITFNSGEFYLLMRVYEDGELYGIYTLSGQSDNQVLLVDISGNENHVYLQNYSSSLRYSSIDVPYNYFNENGGLILNKNHFQTVYGNSSFLSTGGSSVWSMSNIGLDEYEVESEMNGSSNPFFWVSLSKPYSLTGIYIDIEITLSGDQVDGWRIDQTLGLSKSVISTSPYKARVYGYMYRSAANYGQTGRIRMRGPSGTTDFTLQIKVNDFSSYPIPCINGQDVLFGIDRQWFPKDDTHVIDECNVSHEDKQEGRAIQGNGTAYLQLSFNSWYLPNSSYYPTGTITATVDWYNDGTGWVENHTLTTEIDNVNKRITFQSGHIYKGLKWYEDGVLMGVYNFEEKNGYVVNSSYKSDYVYTPSGIPLDYAYHHLTFYNYSDALRYVGNDVPLSEWNTTGGYKYKPKTFKEFCETIVKVTGDGIDISSTTELCVYEDAANPDGSLNNWIPNGYGQHDIDITWGGLYGGTPTNTVWRMRIDRNTFNHRSLKRFYLKFKVPDISPLTYRFISRGFGSVTNLGGNIYELVADGEYDTDQYNRIFDLFIQGDATLVGTDAVIEIIDFECEMECQLGADGKDVVFYEDQNVFALKNHAKILNTPCAKSDGSSYWQFGTGEMSGITVISFEGTATPTVDTINDRITWSSGTMYWVKLSNGEILTCMEGAGTNVYGIYEILSGTIVTSDINDYWSLTQDDVPYNDKYGYYDNSGVKVPASQVNEGYDVLGNALSHAPGIFWRDTGSKLDVTDEAVDSPEYKILTDFDSNLDDLEFGDAIQTSGQRFFNDDLSGKEYKHIIFDRILSGIEKLQIKKFVNI